MVKQVNLNNPHKKAKNLQGGKVPALSERVLLIFKDDFELMLKQKNASDLIALYVFWLNYDSKHKPKSLSINKITKKLGMSYKKAKKTMEDLITLNLNPQ